MVNPLAFPNFRVMKLTLLSLLMCWSHWSSAQAFARSWDAWFGQLQFGAAHGLQTTSGTYRLGLYKSEQNHGYGIDFGGTQLNDSKVLSGNLTLNQDLMRITRNIRSPFYLYANLGIGLTHLRNPLLQDHFLLRGDDMVHFQFGLTPTYFITREFALQISAKYQKQTLIDYQLAELWSVHLGMFFLLSDFKPF